MARTGRRPGDPDTRGEVLAAARRTFADRGYHAATIRTIAAEAGVDPALVHHYFGRKDELFAAAVELPIGPEALATRVFAGGLDGAGTRLAEVFFEVWERQATRQALLTMLRGAFGTVAGAAVLREFFGQVLVQRGAAHMHGDDAALRMSLAAAHLIGIAVLRYVVGFPELRDAEPAALVALVGPRIQGYFD